MPKGGTTNSTLPNMCAATQLRARRTKESKIEEYKRKLQARAMARRWAMRCSGQHRPAQHGLDARTAAVADGFEA